jgi:hypothetical protein
MSKVFWEVLPERHGAAYYESYKTILDVVEYTARLKDYHRLRVRPLPVAHARNAACQAFWETEEIAGKKFEQDPNDTLVMLDADHVLQADIVERLARHDKGVVGALATSRGEVPFICAFGRGADGNLYNMSEWKDGELAECVVTGSGAIAIKRWVLYRLKHCAPSWFRYLYGGHRFESTEEMYFGYECAKAGIPHYVDTSIWIPHCTTYFTTPDDWRQYYKDHPEIKSMVARDLHNAPLIPEAVNSTNGQKGDKWETIGATIKQI